MHYLCVPIDRDVGMAQWQFNRWFVRTFRVVVVLTATLLGLYLLPALLLSFGFAQQWTGERVAQLLTELLATPTEVRRVQLRGWSTLEVEGIAIYDLQGETVLRSRRVLGDISPLDLLLDERLTIRALRLFDTELNLYTDSTTGRLNAQHILDALSSDSDTPPLELAVNTLLMRGTSLRWQGGSPLSIETLDLQVSRLQTGAEGLGALVERLSLQTERGFSASLTDTEIRLASGLLVLGQVDLRMPASHIRLPRLELDLGGRGVGLLRTVDIEQWEVAPEDLLPLVPEVQPLVGHRVSLQGELQTDSVGGVSSRVSLEVDRLATLRADAKVVLDTMGIPVSGLMTLSQLRLEPEVLTLMAEKLPEQASLIEHLGALGRIQLKGSALLGQERRNLGVDLRLQTALGEWTLGANLGQADGRITSVQGRAMTVGFDCAPLVGDIVGLGRTALEADVDLVMETDTDLPLGHISIELLRFTLSGESYEGLDITLRGERSSGYRLALNSQDDKLPLKATGGVRFTLGNLSDLRLSLDTDGLELRRLLPQIAWPMERLSGAVDLALSEPNLDKATGKLHIPRLSLSEGGRQLELRDLSLDLSGVGQERRLEFDAPWAELSMVAHSRLEQIPDLVKTVLVRQIPILSGLGARRLSSDADLRIKGRIDSLPKGLTDYLNLPVRLSSPLHMEAEVSAQDTTLMLRLQMAEAQLLEHTLRALELNVKNGRLDLASDLVLSDGTAFNDAQIQAHADGDHLRLYLDLGADDAGTENGLLQLGVSLFNTRVGVPMPVSNLRELGADIALEPSRLRIHTAYWDIASADIRLGQRLMQIHGLSLSTEGRSIVASGGLGIQGQSALNLYLQNINLRYILGALGVEFDLIDTDLSGSVRVQLSDDSTLGAVGQVTSPHFAVNGYDVGAIDVGLSFNTDDLLIRLDGDVHQGEGYSRVAGWIKPEGGAGLDLSFSATDLDVSFVGSFLDGVFDRISGRASGQMRLHGLFEHGVTVEGEADVRSGVLGVRALGTSFYFDHRLKLEEDRIILDDLTLRDAEGNRAQVRGYITHSYFDKFALNIEATDLRRIKVLDTSSPKDMPVYGVAYASGRASLKGTDQRMSIAVDLRSEPGTDVTLDFNPVSAGRDEQLVRFVRLRSTDEVRVDTVPEPPTSSVAIDMDLRLDITQDARLGMRLTSDLSNEIKGRAEGSIHINAPSSGDAEVYGSLSIIDGTFTFRLEQLANKRFVLKPGGQLAFRGNPMQAVLALDAVYALTANISDLDESLAAMAARTNIPVNCILGLSGVVTRPEVQFDLELPGVDSDIERRVRSLLNSQDAVMRQMFYLIALGKFYTEETADRTSEVTNNWTAVANSAISEQLSSLLGNFTQNFNLGTSIRTRNTTFEDTDIELLFSGSLFGDRLILNGNVGYHDNPYMQNTYLGEFDLEYKLNRQGSLRLKAYNRYNNMYQYLRQSLLTQGFGVVFRQRFDRLSDLVRSSRSREATLPSRTPQRNEED